MTAYEIFTAHKSPKSKVGANISRQLFDAVEQPKKKSKMQNKAIILDSIWFQSQGEGYYYLELKSLLQAGKIQDFKRQIPFEFWVDGIRIGKYVADFGVLNHDGTLEIIDYKGRFTAGLALYKMKKALMLACYQVAIKEVGIQ